MTTSALTTSATPAYASTAYYVYALALGARALDRTRGIAGAAVEALPVEGVTAVVSRTDPRSIQVDAETADALNEDAPLARLIRAHDAVVRRAFEDGPVLPLRFGTLFADADRLASWVGERRTALIAALEDVGSCSEWTLRLLRAEEESEQDAGLRSTGAAYLAARSNERQARLRRREETTLAATRTFEAAAQHAKATVEMALPSRRPGERSCAYLVTPENEDRFITSIAGSRRSLAPLGIDVDLTGPWPPYHFVSLEAVSGG